MTMCYHPWVGLDISPQGEFKPCCKYKNTLATNIQEYESNVELLQLREDFLAGRKPTGCERCWRDESVGLPSKRTLDNEYIFQNTQPDLSSLKVISMPFGNTCNLACRTCSSHSSSRWTQEAKKLLQFYPSLPIFDHAKFYQDPEFMQDIQDRIKDVIRVEIPGGEPFYADYNVHYDFLSSLNRKNVSLHYITNGTTFPDDELLELLTQFKHVDIQISIDGTYTRFEYARWPAKWNRLTVNLYHWREFISKHKNMQLSISHTVSMFTVYHLPEFLDWCSKLGLPDPYLGLVTKPKFYSITILPESVKKDITKRFVDPKLKPVLDIMWSKDDSNELDNFIKAVKILDNQRGQSFAEVYPELYQLLGEKCQTLYQLY